MKLSTDVLEFVDKFRVDNKSYKDLVKAYENSDKPIMLIGPYHCGKRTSVQSLCLDEVRNFYEIDNIKDETQLYGFFGSDGEYQKTALFMAYVNGEVLYIDTGRSALKFIDELLNIQSSTSLKFPCGEFAKAKGFRVIVSVDKESYTEKSKSLREKFEVVMFNYDENVEKNICKDKELYDFLNGVRKVYQNNNIAMTLTTDVFKNAYDLTKIKDVTKEEIIRSALGGNYENYVLELIASEQRKNLIANSYYNVLLEMVKWEL